MFSAKARWQEEKQSSNQKVEGPNPSGPTFFYKFMSENKINISRRFSSEVERRSHKIIYEIWFKMIWNPEVASSILATDKVFICS